MGRTPHHQHSQRITLNSHLCRGGWTQRYRDHRLNNGMGGYGVKSRDPFTCFPDPDVRSADRLNEESKYFFTADKVSMAYVRMYFPDKADKVRHAGGDQEYERREVRYRAGEHHKSNVYYDRKYYELPESSTVTHEGTPVRADECAPDYTTLKVGYLKSDFAKSEFRHFRKTKEGYRNLRTEERFTGWWMTVYTSNNVLLHEGPAPFYRKKLPFNFHTTSDLPGSLLGIDECKFLLPLQRQYNMLLSDVMDHSKRVIRPKYLVNPGVVDEEGRMNLLSNLKQIIFTRGDASKAFQADRPNVLGQEVQFLLKEIPHLMEMILAQPEILQGQRPEGARSGEFIKELAAQAMPRTTAKVSRFESSVAQLMEDVFCDYMLGMPPVVERIINGEMKRLYPQDYLDAKLKFEVEA